MGTIEEYSKRGGIRGIALQTLQDELAKASGDATHPLGNAVTALQNGDQEQAVRLLVAALREADGNSASSLYLPALFFYRLPAISTLIEYATQNFSNDDILGNMPPAIIRWASVGVVLKEIKSRQGGRKGKTWKAKVIDYWEEHGSPKPYKAEAIKFIETNGGFGSDGNPQGKGVPSQRTIVRWIGEYARRKNTIC